MGKKRAGFTIVELLIVIVVIGILAAITIVAYNGVQSRARDVKRKSDVAQIAKGLKAWATTSGSTFGTSNIGGYAIMLGWFTTAAPVANYSATSVKNLLVQNDYLNDSVQEPAYVYNSKDYLIDLCVDSGADSRRVVMTRLENPPPKTIAETYPGCAGYWFNVYQASPFYANYGILVDDK